MTRPTRDEYFIALAKAVATRATCLRRSVGCVLVDDLGHILSTGYNGRAAGLPHCNEITGYDIHGDFNNVTNDVYTNNYSNACAGAKAKSGESLDACEAIHAEQNALLQCRDAHQIQTCYVTVSPCVTCVKLLLNTSCKRIVFPERYAHDEAARNLWNQLSREWVNVAIYN